MRCAFGKTAPTQQEPCLVAKFGYVRPVVTARDEIKRIYRVDVFRDTALTRVLEAKLLLDKAKRRCDGAVVCALLSTECALKATLLFGYGVTYDHELSDELYKRYFRSKVGHALGELCRALPAKVRRSTLPIDELRRLDQCERYEYRYGARRPRLTEARPVIMDAQAVVSWMEQVLS